MSINLCFGQIDSERLEWSATRRLTIDDYGIKVGVSGASIVFTQFLVSYNVGGFDFMIKNFNKKVNNYALKSASWIDTTANVKESIAHQQTIFDISEIYVRKFRKALRKDRWKIAKGTEFIDELNRKIMTDFSKRRIDYDLETNGGRNLVSQKRWEVQIQMELLELAEFAHDK